MTLDTGGAFVKPYTTVVPCGGKPLKLTLSFFIATELTSFIEVQKQSEENHETYSAGKGASANYVTQVTELKSERDDIAEEYKFARACAPQRVEYGTGTCRCNVLPELCLHWPVAMCIWHFFPRRWNGFLSFAQS